MIHPPLVKHEQFFPVSEKDIFSDVTLKAEQFLIASAKENPSFEYVISFQKGGILVQGREAK